VPPDDFDFFDGTGQEFVDSGLKVRDAVKHAATNPLLGDFPKPTFHQVQPGSTRRGEVQLETWPFIQPSLDGGMGMGAVVVQDKVQWQRVGKSAVQLPQKGQELLVAVARKALTDNRAFQYVQGSKQGRRPVTLVVMGHGAAAAFLHRQTRLRAVECLNAASSHQRTGRPPCPVG